MIIVFLSIHHYTLFPIIRDILIISKVGYRFLYPIMKALHYIAFTLLIIGGLNWLLVGLFQWDIGMLFGGQTGIASRIIYILVGLATIIVVATHRKDCKVCSGEMPMSAPEQKM